MKDFDKNDVEFGRKTFVMTLVSLWITLWKLGISLAAQGGFDKNMGKKCGKVDRRIFVHRKIDQISQNSWGL